MKVETFLACMDSEFYTGVPDSQLKALCDYLVKQYEISDRHIIAANEGNAVALAAGYYLSTGKIPLVYMQNSGIGNIINPAVSLMHKKVYAIPCIYVVGWRGEPNVHDEPQHIYQGEVTIKLLEDIGIRTFVIRKETSEFEVQSVMKEFRDCLNKGEGVAFIIAKDALTYEETIGYGNDYSILREEAIRHIVRAADDDVIISTTGKVSRELFEIREEYKQGHSHDFLTVGSMGHCSSIALGVALHKKERKVWCIDGDGAVIMHMGAMSVVGNRKPNNLIHIIIDNASHETVGGMPTVSKSIDWEQVAYGYGYQKVIDIFSVNDLDLALKEAKRTNKLTLVIVRCSVASRKSLGRPTTTPGENKSSFMKYMESR